MQVLHTDLMLSRQLSEKYFTHVFTPLLVKYSLSRIELDVLLFLHNNPGYDKAKDIVDVRGMAKSYVSKAVEMLGDKQHLTAVADEKDRRVMHLTLTESGRGIAAKGRKLQMQIAQQMIEGISPEELACLKSVMHKMTRNLKKGLET